MRTIRQIEVLRFFIFLFYILYLGSTGHARFQATISQTLSVSFINFFLFMIHRTEKKVPSCVINTFVFHQWQYLIHIHSQYFFSLSILWIPPACLPINSFICFVHLGKTRFTITIMYGPLLALAEGFGNSQGLLLAIQAKISLLFFFPHCKPFQSQPS